MIQIAEVPIPNAVLIRASEIPFAKADESVDPPELPNDAKALIIPITVPNRPIKVDTDAKVAIIVKFFSNIGNSNEVASSTSLLNAANFCSLSKPLSVVKALYFLTAAKVTFPTEPFCLSQAFKAPSTSSLSKELVQNERMRLHHQFLLLYR